jgi:hypothetical protein
MLSGLGQLRVHSYTCTRVVVSSPDMGEACSLRRKQHIALLMVLRHVRERTSLYHRQLASRLCSQALRRVHT